MRWSSPDAGLHEIQILTFMDAVLYNIIVKKL
jgi:hypothetical protein